MLRYTSVYGSSPRRAQPATVPRRGHEPPQPRQIIYFDQGSSELRPIYRERLRMVARRLKNSVLRRPVVIEGHANRRESEREALELSLRRAQAVAAVLRRLGVPQRRIEIEPVGSYTRPVNAAPARVAAWNRRVELSLPPPPSAAAVAEIPKVGGPRASAALALA